MVFTFEETKQTIWHGDEENKFEEEEDEGGSPLRKL